jgi:hypothetical protein
MADDGNYTETDSLLFYFRIMFNLPFYLFILHFIHSIHLCNYSINILFTLNQRLVLCNQMYILYVKTRALPIFFIIITHLYFKQVKKEHQNNLLFPTSVNKTKK